MKYVKWIESPSQYARTWTFTVLIETDTHLLLKDLDAYGEDTTRVIAVWKHECKEVV